MYTYLNFKNPTYRPIGALVVILGTLNANHPGGWHHGINNVINVFISLGLTMLTYTLAASLRRNSIKRALYQLTYLLAESYVQARGKASPSATSNTTSQYAALALKLNVMVNKMWYIFRSEQVLQSHSRNILHHVRTLMIDHSFLRHLPQHLDTLQTISPSTDKLLADISQRLLAAATGLLSPNDYSPIKNKELYQQWQKEYKAYQPDNSPEQQNTRMLLFALECILHDLEDYEDAIVHFSNTTTSADGSEPPPSPTSGHWKQLFMQHFIPRQKPSLIDSFSHARETAEQQHTIQTEYSKSAFRIALAAAASVFIWKGAHMPHGYWIFMTVIIIYCGVNQGNFLQRSSGRLIGTFAGILLTFLFVHDFLIFNLTWAYTLPLVFFFTIYLYLLTGNYGIMSLFITLFTGIMLSTLAGARPDFFLYGTLYYRLLCTMIAAVLVLLAELTIFPHILRSATTLQRTWHVLIQDLSDSLQTIVLRYTRQTPFSTDEWHNLTGIIEKYASTGKLHHLMQYEVSIPDKYESLYKEGKTHIDLLLSAFSNMTAIATHEKPHALNNEAVSQITQMGNTLSVSLKELEQQNISTDTSNLSEKIRAHMTRDLEPLLFVQALTYLAQQIEELQHVTMKRRTA